MHVTRCVCHGLPFLQLLTIATETGADFARLREITGCCTACTMCEPYVRRALADGNPNQPVMSAAELSRWMGSPKRV